MKICFVISCINSKSKGNGGHYHSLITLINLLKEHHKITLILIGDSESQILEKESIKPINILSDSVNFVANYKKLNRIFKEKDFDVIHSFDHFAHFWVRLFAYKYKKPIVMTKCGGKNPTHYFPYSPYFILYSLENYNYFKSKSKFESSQLNLVPNRVFPFECSNTRINQIKELYPLIDSYNYKFFRICRIGHSYKNSLIQLINLVNKLKADGIKCCLILVGIIEDENIFEEIKSLMEEDLFLLNEKEFVQNAKELINIADIVLGTGRSFMEACSQSKVMLSPILESKIPLLIDSSNINQVLEFNISERVKVVDYDENENYQEILKMLHNKNRFIELQNFSVKLFDDSFNILSVIKFYNELYSKVTYKKEKWLDFILNALDYIVKYKFKL